MKRKTIKTVTENTFPPIPIRCYDWCAYLDGREECGPYGWGETEAEALADLDAQLRSEESELLEPEEL